MEFFWETIETYVSDQGSWANPVEETIDITPYINDNLQICFFMMIIKCLLGTGQLII